MASDNGSLKNSYDLGRVEVPLILHMIKRDITSQYQSQRQKKIQTFKSVYDDIFLQVL